MTLSLYKGLRFIKGIGSCQTPGVSSKTIKRHIKEMDNVRYIGSGYSGHWEIIE